MKLFEERTPDTQYRDRLLLIRSKGELVGKTPQGVGALTLFGELPPMVFDMSSDTGNGIPMITERDISGFWKQSIDEIFSFIRGVRTNKELKKNGCHFWGPWVTKDKCAKRGLKEGDLGPGSYGAAFHDFPTAEGEPFNQFAFILQQILERPELRTHFISPWIPQYAVRVTGRTQKVVVCTCHGWIHIRIMNGKAHLHMFQRSADMPIGVPSNMIQYAALLLALAHVTGYKVGKYCHSFSDAHIYKDQLVCVDEMLSREPRQLPTLSIAKDAPSDLFSFRSEHFVLSDYNPHPVIKDIPVGI